MDISTREENDVLIIYLEGPFTEALQDWHAFRDQIGRVVDGHTGRLIICLRNIVLSKSVHIAMLFHAVADGRFIKHPIYVATNTDDNSVWTVASDRAFRAFNTEEQVLEYLYRPRTSAARRNWLWTIPIVIFVVAYIGCLSN